MNNEYGGEGMPPNGLGAEGDGFSSRPTAVNSDRIRRVFDYWTALRRDRPYPAWTDVKLMDVYDVASFLAVLDVEAARDLNGARYRYRFCGTYLVEARSSMIPADPTGCYIDEIQWPFDVSPILAACAGVVTQRRPTMLAAGEVDESHYHRHERGFFPLGPDGQGVTHIIVCVDEMPRR